MNTIPVNDPVRLYRRLQPEIDAAIAQVEDPRLGGVSFAGKTKMRSL
jgi:hypothetical protein